MKKYLTLILVLICAGCRDYLIAAINFYARSFYAQQLAISLQYIGGVISIGGVVAYLIGPSIAEIRKKQRIIQIAGALGIIVFSRLYNQTSYTLLQTTFILVSIGLCYGFWTVLKNIYISLEIEKTGLTPTKITGALMITFVVTYILGTVTGSALFEGLGKDGIRLFVGLLIITIIASWGLVYPQIDPQIDYHDHSLSSRLHKSLHHYIPEVRKVFQTLGVILLILSAIRGVIAVAGQEMINVGVHYFGKSESQASYVMMYAIISFIIGNVLTFRVTKNARNHFIGRNSLAALIVIALPRLIQASITNNAYRILIAIAVVLGLSIGASINIIEAHYFKTLAQKDMQIYGSTSFGLAQNAVIGAIMLGSFLILQYFAADYVFSLQLLFTLLGLILIGGSLLVHHKKSHR